MAVAASGDGQGEEIRGFRVTELISLTSLSGAQRQSFSNTCTLFIQRCVRRGDRVTKFAANNMILHRTRWYLPSCEWQVLL